LLSVEILVQALMSGLLMGFIFSLIAIGLTLICGVMDLPGSVKFGVDY